MAIFQSPKNIFQRPKFAGKPPEIPQKERFLPNFRLRNFENSEPEKMQFHTPSHSIPPLDSLLFKHFEAFGCLDTCTRPAGLQEQGIQ